MAGPEGSRNARGPSRVPREPRRAEGAGNKEVQVVGWRGRAAWCGCWGEPATGSPVWALTCALSPEPFPKMPHRSLQIKDSEGVRFVRGVSLQLGELSSVRLMVERGSRGQVDGPWWSPCSRSLASPDTRPQWRKCLKTNRPKSLPEASRWAEDSGANSTQSVTRVAGSLPGGLWGAPPLWGQANS